MTTNVVLVLFNRMCAMAFLIKEAYRLAGRSFFIRDERGSATTEFVVIFPIIILMIFFIVSVSIFIATAGEVQQISYELARAAIGLVDGPQSNLDICTQLSADVLPQLLDAAIFVNADKLAPLAACPDQPLANRSISITVSYNLSGTALQDLASSVGLDFGTIVRTAHVQL